MIDRIENWVVVMFENRSFDNLLGHLPHIDAEDGIRDQEIILPYPKGTVTVHPGTNLSDPIPDPGEEYVDVNVQLYGAYRPEGNRNKAAYTIFPDFMEPPYNAPLPGQVPTMDGFALNYYYTALWQLERELTSEEMQSIGSVFTPRTAPVINSLAEQYAVFTHWHCDVPTCTFPNRTFFHAGTSQGRVQNNITYDYAWDNDLPNLFDLLTEHGRSWKCYFDEGQVVPLTAINLAGARHLALWREHSVHMPEFFDDCANGTLPAYSWVEPKMMFGSLSDYHPPEDVRAGEQFLAKIYNAVRTSPQWETTALVIMFDEHGGCYDHVPPPAAVPPDDHPGEQGFTFDRLGVRVPTIVVSPYTKRGTVIRDVHSNTSMTHTLQEQLGLGEPLTARVAAARTIEAAFNRSQPRRDMHQLDPLPYVPGRPNPGAQPERPGDIPDSTLWKHKVHQHDSQFVSHLGEVTLQNAAAFLREGHALPSTAADARAWLRRRFDHDGRFTFPRRGS